MHDQYRDEALRTLWLTILWLCFPIKSHYYVLTIKYFYDVLKNFFDHHVLVKLLNYDDLE
jgi:hypothetical protein